MIRRVVVAVLIIVAAVLSVPAAQAPGINAADIICILAAPAFVGVVLAPRKQVQR